MTDTPDTRSMTGAEFMRWAGTDPQKWAEAFVAANYPDGVHMRTRAETVEFVAKWLCDFAEVKIAEALRGETDTACQRTS